MGPVSWQFIGKRSSDSYDGSEIEEAVAECTSEYNGFVDVIVYENHTQFVGKTPLKYYNELYLAVCTTNFIIIVVVNVVNTNDRNLMYEKETVDCDDLKSNI